MERKNIEIFNALKGIKSFNAISSYIHLNWNLVTSSEQSVTKSEITGHNFCPWGVCMREKNTKTNNSKIVLLLYRMLEFKQQLTKGWGVGGRDVLTATRWQYAQLNESISPVVKWGYVISSAQWDITEIYCIGLTLKACLKGSLLAGGGVFSSPLPHTCDLELRHDDWSSSTFSVK